MQVAIGRRQCNCRRVLLRKSVYPSISSSPVLGYASAQAVGSRLGMLLGFACCRVCVVQVFCKNVIEVFCVGRVGWLGSKWGVFGASEVQLLSRNT